MSSLIDSELNEVRTETVLLNISFQILDVSVRFSFFLSSQISLKLADTMC